MLYLKILVDRVFVFKEECFHRVVQILQPDADFVRMHVTEENTIAIVDEQYSNISIRWIDAIDQRSIRIPRCVRTE